MNKLIRRCLKPSLVLISLCVLDAAAAGDAAVSSADSGWSSLRALLALLVVLALILIGAWMARRFLPFLPQNSQKGDQIQILAVRALGPRRSLHLLQIDGHRLLVGSTDNNISLVKDLSGSAVSERSQA